MLGPLKSLARPIRVALPFVGMDGFGELMRRAGVPYIANNVYDSHDNLASYYHQLGSLIGERSAAVLFIKLATARLRAQGFHHKASLMS